MINAQDFQIHFHYKDKMWTYQVSKMFLFDDNGNEIFYRVSGVKRNFNVKNIDGKWSPQQKHDDILSPELLRLLGNAIEVAEAYDLPNVNTKKYIYDRDKR